MPENKRMNIDTLHAYRVADTEHIVWDGKKVSSYVRSRAVSTSLPRFTREE